MAKRRDSVSRKATRDNRESTRENGGKPIQNPMKVNRETRNLLESRGENPAAMRQRGRRGVRARQRAARMNQPPESKNGNSP